MTRKKAKSWTVKEFFDNGYSVREGVNILIDKIFDEHERFVDFVVNSNRNLSDEEKNNLKSEIYKKYKQEIFLTKYKSCEKCKHFLVKVRMCAKKVQLNDGSLPKNFYCKYYELKATT